MQQMAGPDLVVATRYHNVVCALRMGKPTISIGYAAKNDALLAEMGLADYCQHIEELDVEILQAQTLRLISERRNLEQQILETGARFQSALRRQEDVLTSLIFGAATSGQPPSSWTREILPFDARRRRGLALTGRPVAAGAALATKGSAAALAARNPSITGIQTARRRTGRSRERIRRPEPNSTGEVLGKADRQPPRFLMAISAPRP